MPAEDVSDARLGSELAGGRGEARLGPDLSGSVRDDGVDADGRRGDRPGAAAAGAGARQQPDETGRGV